MRLVATASQTVGPFFDIGLEKLCVADLTKSAAGGEKVSIQGRVLDGDGKPVNDALIEIWQADDQGKYAHQADGREKLLGIGFKGFGRAATGDHGDFRFVTIKPGRVSGPRGVLQAPHLVVAVFMRGLLKHLVTRMYFPGEASNEEDAVLALVPKERRATLVAKPAVDGVLEWNLNLQGRDETVFFDC
ncbi:MAG TPA: protocatechuate 3,4-dioxygenase subunit alpha [Burkholderiales bacterium]|nr:protocatechuate 3,4-dioxygenase subunit alpha [Burkholderiales bacterium]